MDKQTNAESSRRRRTSGLVLNPVQVGLAVGFIAVALLIVFGLGVIIGMWYQASGHISPYADAMPAAEERPPAAPDSGSTSPDVTFYSTLTTSETAPAPLLSPLSTSGEAQEASASPAPPAAPFPPVPPVAPPPPEPATGATPPLAPPSSEAVSKPLPPPTEPFYSVQVGSFRVAEQAETLRQRLVRKGYDVRVRLSMVPGQGAWYRVRVGQFSTRAAAEGVARRLHSQERIPVMVAVE
jgi:cell division protein FtsN